MKDGSTQPCVMFPELFGKPLVARFDQPHGSSDGGAVLLKACDERLRLTERMAGCFRDERQAGKVMHTLHDLSSKPRGCSMWWRWRATRCWIGWPSRG